MASVTIPTVRAFSHVAPDKAHALKPLDEVEAFWAWQRFYECPTKTNEELLVDECADVIQATCNLVAALGVEDFRPWMKACERRNRERGRITDGEVVDE